MPLFTTLKLIVQQTKHVKLEKHDSKLSSITHACMCRSAINIFKNTFNGKIKITSSTLKI